MPTDNQDYQQLGIVDPTPPNSDRNEPSPSSFFTIAEMSSVTELTDKIIPADEYSGGAKAAGVAQCIDEFLAASSHEVQQRWKNGLAALNEISLEMFGRELCRISGNDQIRLLSEISERECDPVTPSEEFFKILKLLTWRAYYRSAVGIHEELRYRGSESLKGFEGCSHVEHQ